MRLDRKEVAEHMMLVDLARNDVARVSDAGHAPRRPKLMTVERYARVMHLVSSVTGTLRGDRDALSRAAGLPQRRHADGRAQDPRDRVAARDRSHQARALWRRGRLAQRRGNDGHRAS